MRSIFENKMNIDYFFMLQFQFWQTIIKIMYPSGDI